MAKNLRQKIKLLLIPCIDNQYRPRLLSSRFLIYYIALLAILKLIGATYIVLLPKTNFFADISSQALLVLTNSNRKEIGLLPLSNNSQLAQAAYLKAQDMLNNDYFNHNSPIGITPWYWIKKANYNYKYAGENLAIGFIDSEETFKAWMESPSHYANIINSRYQETGIAVLKGDFQGSDTFVVVQMFGSPWAVTNVNSPTKKPITTPAISPTPKPPVDPIPVNTSIVAPLSTVTNLQGNESAVVSGDETEVIDTDFDQAKIDSMMVISSQKLTNAQYYENTLLFKIIKFFSDKYSRVLEIIVFISLFLLTLSLLINIFIHIEIQHRDLIIKTSLMLILLIAFILINKSQLVLLISQSLTSN